MVESKQVRIKRPDSSIDLSEYCETENGIETVTKSSSFQSLCSKEKIKEGMRVLFANPVLPNINLTFEQTGMEQTFKAQLTQGIIMKSENGDFLIFTIVKGISSQNFLKFIGRFARANYDSTLKTVIAKTIEQHISGANVRIITSEEYAYFFNGSLLFVDYLFKNIGNSQIFIGRKVAINPETKVLHDLMFKPQILSPEKGYVGICIIPNVARCIIKPCKQIKTEQSMTYSISPYKYYIEML